MDKYDRNIAELLAGNPSPEEFHRRVKHAWFNNQTNPLFGFCTKDDHGHGGNPGCLTMIRQSRTWVAETPELTEAIRTDTRIPNDYSGILPEHLEVFAEWQRRLDRELHREVEPLADDMTVTISSEDMSHNSQENHS